MAQLSGNQKGQANRLPDPSVEELARDFTTELLRWRGNMSAESIVGEAFALARAFKTESKKESA